MTKWKQRRREREQLTNQFATAALPVFLDRFHLVVVTLFS